MVFLSGFVFCYVSRPFPPSILSVCCHPLPNSNRRSPLLLLPRRRSPPSPSNSVAATMGTTYRCSGCGVDLNLSAAHLYPQEAQFGAGNKGTLSFSWVDEAQLRFAKEDRIKPFFETSSYWGILRRRTRLLCDACGHLLGYVYEDGPPSMNGLDQDVHRSPRRYRFKIKALNISSL